MDSIVCARMFCGAMKEGVEIIAGAVRDHGEAVVKAAKISANSEQIAAGNRDIFPGRSLGGHATPEDS